ncbi:hypothetical protein K3495_g1216 [Podosphaera aphanis]|nr:hypothetical protein K3495_g1216 [Podosphaera aphanis]
MRLEGSGENGQKPTSIGPLSSGCPSFGQMKLGQQMAIIRDA